MLELDEEGVEARVESELDNSCVCDEAHTKKLHDNQTCIRYFYEKRPTLQSSFFCACTCRLFGGRDIVPGYQVDGAVV